MPPCVSSRSARARATRMIYPAAYFFPMRCLTRRAIEPAFSPDTARSIDSAANVPRCISPLSLFSGGCVRGRSRGSVVETARFRYTGILEWSPRAISASEPRKINGFYIAVLKILFFVFH